LRGKLASMGRRFIGGMSAWRRVGYLARIEYYRVLGGKEILLTASTPFFATKGGKASSPGPPQRGSWRTNKNVPI